MTLSNYKAILFDWDGTLTDTCGLVVNAHNHVRAHYGFKLWTMDDFLGQASQSAREYYPTVYGDQADEAMKLLYQYVDENHLKSLKSLANSAALLDRIKTKNIPMGVVSNKRHKTLNIEVDYMQWRDYFDVTIGAGKAKRDKPSADPLLMALDLMEGSLTPDDILYVGDTETDLICAGNAGCDVALIQSDKPRPDLIEKYTPKYACHDLADFMKRMEG